MIIPVRDEAVGIAALLGDLLQQSRPPLEILVIDTGSRDSTVAVVEQVAATDRRVRLLFAPGSLPGGGRNAGLRAAAGEWVAFVDGGMRVGRDWLRSLFAPVDAGQAVDAVLGGLEPVADGRAGRAAALAFVPARREAPNGDKWRGFCLPSSAARTSVALRVGGFPEDLRSGEDHVFHQRLQAVARFGYATDAVVEWRHASSVAAVWKRFRTYAESGFRAGLMDDWFGVLARRTVGIGIVFGPALPVATVGVWLARAAVMQRRKPEFVDASRIGRVWQLVEVALYLGVIDAATWAAWWRWRSLGRPRSDLDKRPL